MIAAFENQQISAGPTLPNKSPILNIVILCDHAHVSGGLAQVAISSAVQLRKSGHRVILFAAVGPIADSLTESGVEVHCLEQADLLGDESQLRAAVRGVWNLVAAKRVTELLATLDPSCSIVHIHGWSKALSPSVVRACLTSGLPSVQTLHDYTLLCPNGGLFDYVEGRNCPLEPMSASCITHNCDARNYAHKLWRTARLAILQQYVGALKDTDLILLSQRQYDLVKKDLPETARIHFVTNPIEIVKSEAVSVAHNDTFLFIGRLSPEKGPDLLARAAALADVKAVLVGDGPMHDSLVGLPNVTITGWQSRPEVQSWLQRARALVFPSRWYETFGLSVLEAMAKGVPAIVSDNTTASAFVTPNETGLLFRSGDVEDLSRAILRLKEQPQLAQALGNAAYQGYWQSPFTLDRHVLELEGVYRTIIANRASRSSGVRRRA
jgi:glycosyltransferase involved in cell wall biosynthesis